MIGKNDEKKYEESNLESKLPELDYGLKQKILNGLNDGWANYWWYAKRGNIHHDEDGVIWQVKDRGVARCLGVPDNEKSYKTLASMKMSLEKNDITVELEPYTVILPKEIITDRLNENDSTNDYESMEVI